MQKSIHTGIPLPTVPEETLQITSLHQVPPPPMGVSQQRPPQSTLTSIYEFNESYGSSLGNRFVGALKKILPFT